ncbi:MAG: hypothetical protein A2Z99_14560 [Treponema sp. GWB1_62_6]|nr:MAG: hypothetical protein A2Y36_01190 [Treponema sp. GWA1_62_8]OHE68722.1 MAG: hypothetical protein A2Z99_14560 [Treponema sp. GWB1_62_6]OHE68820.1 MAG: hypothetical protein A2001_20865 [Treponema sp. GWC1_61_84]OHE76239.1 MAG: hypothetical protein A2413_01200 [Treponema sp. RIFOXYC1_FULL_61_9]HCM28664.1 hypothetical protein [Treponema sp.]
MEDPGRFRAEALWKEWFPRVTVYVRSSFPVMGAEAEDIAQETFLRLVGKVREVGPNPAALLYRIARNLCIDTLRKKRTVPFGEEAAQVPDTAEGPEASAMSRESGDEARAAMEALPPGDRELCFLRYFEELSVRDIARLVGKSEGTVKFGLFRARGKIRKALEDRNEEERRRRIPTG